VDELVVSDVRVTVDEVTSVVVAVDELESVEDVEDDVLVGSVEVVVSIDVVVGEVVRVELSIGLNLTAPADATFEITPIIANERISVSTINMGVDFIYVCLVSLKPLTLSI